VINQTLEEQEKINAELRQQLDELLAAQVED
jgi:hypothetical protein